ncbi:MAG: ATP-binding protein [Cyanobacteria bacterium P01_G01_bin.54]
MFLDVRQLFRAVAPSHLLAVSDASSIPDSMDFSDLQGIDELKNMLSFVLKGQDCHIPFTSFPGNGQTQALLSLKRQLEAEDCSVVVCNLSKTVEQGDIDVPELVLAIADPLLQNLAQFSHLPCPRLGQLLAGAIALTGDISIFERSILSTGDLSSGERTLGAVRLPLATLLFRAQNDSAMRAKIREYFSPRTEQLIQIVNAELLEPAIAHCNVQGKSGLVMIVDGLHLLETILKPWGRPQTEYLFIDRGTQLTQLLGQWVWAMPLSLRFSPDYPRLTACFGSDIFILPLIPVRQRNGQEYREGLPRLQQWVLTYAFPESTPEERLANVMAVFESLPLLDQLCFLSGGYRRELLRLWHDWIKRERALPLTPSTLDEVVQIRYRQLACAVNENEWELLRQVCQTKRVTNEHQTLLRSLMIFSYWDVEGNWFDVNPILMQAPQLHD